MNKRKIISIIGASILSIGLITGIVKAAAPGLIMQNIRSRTS